MFEKKRSSFRAAQCSRSTLTLAALGAAFALSGKVEEARKILQELAELGRQKYVSHVLVAGIYAGLGGNDRALTCLEQAHKDRCTWLLRSLAVDMKLDPLA